MTLILMAALALSAAPVTPMDALLTDVPGAAKFSNAQVTQNGLMHITVRHTTSTFSEAALQEHFAARFEKVGIPVAKADKGIVAGMDPGTGIAYSAIVSSKDATTHVMVTSFEVAFESPAPLFPGASHITTTFSEVSYRAEASAQTVEHFYAENLAAAGWEQVRPMVFVKGDRQLFVDVMGYGEDSSVQVQSRSIAP